MWGTGEATSVSLTCVRTRRRSMARDENGMFAIPTASPNAVSTKEATECNTNVFTAAGTGQRTYVTADGGTYHLTKTLPRCGASPN